MVGEKLVEIIDGSFSYPEGTPALHSVNFAVAPGEIVGILAANGGGKTTLAKAIVGLIKLQGQVLVAGRALANYRQRELYQKVGMVLQNPDDQLFGATVADDVAFGPRHLGLAEREVRIRVTENLALVGAEHLEKRPIHKLSFGEQKRVALAGVLAMRPAVLVLDEPTAGLDPAGELRMVKLLLDLNEKSGITIILATHAVDILPLLAHRVCILHHGRVLRAGPTEEVLREEEILESAGLRLPYVAQLFAALKKNGAWSGQLLPLSVAAACREWAGDGRDNCPRL